MDTVRRSRLQPSSTGKRLELTPRDFAIFAVLERYRYLRSTYLHAFAGGLSETRFKERLGDLFHEGYIGRPPSQWDMAGCRYQPVVHEAAKGSKRALAAHASPCVSPVTFLAADGARRQFLHALQICEVLASIELTTIGTPGLRFVSWGEILGKAPAETRMLSQPFRLTLRGATHALIPDGLFGLEYLEQRRRTYRFFAVEVDRGTMPVSRSDPRQSSVLGKLRTYDEAIASGLAQRQWGIPNLLVLVVTSDRARAGTILEQIGASRLDARRHLVTSADAVGKLTHPAPAALLTPLRRAGLSELCIALP